MIELKVIDVDKMADVRSLSGRFYRKHEVDEVIAKKDAEIARLNAIRKVHVEAIESMGAGLLQDEEENRHSKYKRCLAMSEMCNANYFRQYMFKPNFWKRWHNRWLKIAENFKEDAK